MRKIAIFILLIVFACSCTSFLEEYSQDEAKIESLQDLDELLLGEVYSGELSHMELWYFF